MHNPRTSHLQAVKRILRYVKGTISVGITFHSSSNFSLRAFSDADWAGSPDDRRSTTGVCVFIGPNLVAWTAKKQSTISLSSSEAEYRALPTTTAELKWFSYLYCELGTSLHPSLMYCDNLSALHMSKNPIFHARTRYIETDYHFVSELQQRGFLYLRYFSTADQLVDLFTKSLSGPRLTLLLSKLQLRSTMLGLRVGVTDY